jgi:CubicO group peptidase (beta-lactamase class C family)
MLADRDVEIPSTGLVIPALSAFDQMMTAFLREHRIPGGALAVGRHGKLLYARGFGWARQSPPEPVSPETRFRLASVSKPITAHAILTLVDRGLLALNDRVLDRMPPEYVATRPTDDRWRDIRIEHLLRHTGGWDKEKSRDPMFESRAIAAEMDVPSPPGVLVIAQRQMRRPLDFAPGDRYAYSNFGYLLLGRVIEHATGSRYADAVRDLVFAPRGLADSFTLGATLPQSRLPGEAAYFDDDRTGVSVFDPEQGHVPTPYGSWCLEAMDAHGGWVATAPALVRWSLGLARPEDGGLRPETWWGMRDRPAGLAGWTEDGKPRDTYYGLGWQIRPTGRGIGFHRWHAGSLDGTSTLLVQRDDGLCWAALFNSRRTGQAGKTPAQLVDSELHRVANEVREWPDRDVAADR